METKALSLIAKKSRRRRHVELYPSLHVLRVVLLDVFYGDRERGRCVFRRRIDHSKFPGGGNSKNDRILCPLRPLCFTLAVDLRDTTRRGRFSKATTPFLLEGLS